MPKTTGTASRIFSALLGSPALGTTNAVLGDTAMASGATTLVTTGITQPDVPRAVSITGNGAAVTGNVTITGTNIVGDVITEVIALAGAATVLGTKAFKTITSILLPPWAVANTERVRVGLTARLGLPVAISRDSIVAAFLGGVREATRPTVTFSASAIESDTVTLNSALNGSAVIVDYYETN